MRGGAGQRSLPVGLRGSPTGVAPQEQGSPQPQITRRAPAFRDTAANLNVISTLKDLGERAALAAEAGTMRPWCVLLAVALAACASCHGAVVTHVPAGAVVPSSCSADASCAAAIQTALQPMQLNQHCPVVLPPPRHHAVLRLHASCSSSPVPRTSCRVGC